MKAVVVDGDGRAKITKSEIKDKARQIMALPLSEIDLFWYNCGWAEWGKGSNKSLPSWRLKKIKENLNFATQSLENLFLETPKKDFLEEFNKLKKLK